MQAEAKQLVKIFTDGACSGNPGPGGWAVLLCWQNTEKILTGSEPETTNNRMELKATIEGLAVLKFPCEVLLTTDSVYVHDGITKWINKWQINNWKTANGKPVKNQDLWRELLKLSKLHKINWCWVKGHADHRENNRVDLLARQAALELKNNMEK